jgi:carbon-monoxide dehydrogenase iron sulfur subunit
MDKEMKRIRAKEEYCIGCRLCEIYCFVQHSKSRKLIKAFREEGLKPVPRLFVEEKGCFSFAVQCRHCEDAPCLDACSTGAMHRDEKGAILCDENQCAGCWMCVMVCPLGVIRTNRKERRIASKCDLCEGEPVCVKNCPNEALTYE